MISKIAEIFSAAQGCLGHKSYGLPCVPALAKCDFLGAGFDALCDLDQDISPLGRWHVAPFCKRRRGCIGRGINVIGRTMCYVANHTFIDG